MRIASDNSPQKLAASLEYEIGIQLKREFGYDVWEGVTISHRILAEISISSIQSIGDMRNSYPHTVSSIKYISNIAFWIVKLKPIMINALVVAEAGEKPRCVSDSKINEKIAFIWLLHKICRLTKDGQFKEIIDDSEKSMLILKNFVQNYISGNMYKNVADGQPVDLSSKFNETVHNSRYKKITAINIYEMITHALVGTGLPYTDVDQPIG